MMAHLPGFGRQVAEKLRSDSSELYTPQWLIDALGPVALDPCASFTRQFAMTNLTKDDDGLSGQWLAARDSLVFCNPPYSNPLQERFCRKAHEEWARGNAALLVLLIQARVETKYWHECVWPMAEAVLFPQGRIAFVDKNNLGDKGGSFASAIIIARQQKWFTADVLAAGALERRLIAACEKAGHPARVVRP